PSPPGAPHTQDAYELNMGNTAPEHHTIVFRGQGNFPSATESIGQIADAKDPYFSDAPIGKIFGDAAEQAPVQVLGLHDKDIADQINNALSEVERKGTAPETAWSNAKKAVKNALG
ncbi:carbohydrate ABC transporter substrate-binding protein, partial [Streptomyces vinaceus]